MQGVCGTDPVDLRDPDGRQQARERQQVGVCPRDGDARHGVGCDVETEEEDRIGERGRRDHVLPGDVDAREADRGQDGDDEEVRELAVPGAHRGTSCSYVRTVRSADP